MPPFDSIKFDAQAFSDNEKAVQEVRKQLQDVIPEVVKTVINVELNDRPFSFSSFPRVNREVNEIFGKLVKKMIITVNNHTFRAWLLAHAKNDKFIDYVAQKYKLKKAVLRKKYRFGVRNEEALKAFQERKIAGMDLSDRVWRISRQAKAEMQVAIDVALTEGKSAAQLSRDVRSLLNDPNRLFRRVRDKSGNLVLSRNAKVFKPGQGVYRSSAKNAMRLARTEVNMAYREADHLRWSQMDFVTGIEVKLSNNPKHCPVCVAKAGKYPKTVKFVGWHPQCRCFAVPVLD